MESNRKPVGIKQEFCGVEIKEEVSFELIEEESCNGGMEEESGIVNDIKEEKESFDLACVQSFTSDIIKEENILVNLIKKEDWNNIDVNEDNQAFIQEEEEIDYVWPADAVEEIDPLALPEIKYEVEGTEHLHFPKILIGLPDLVPKVEAELVTSALFHDCPIKLQPNPLEEHGDIQGLLPKIKIEAPSREVKRELRILLKRIDVPVPRVVSPCEVRQTDNKKNKTRNAEKEETVASKRLSRSSYRKNFKTSSCNVNIPEGKQYNTERPFKCNECLYTCVQLGNLKRPFKCKECLHTCAQLDHLKTHMRSHTEERPFKCKECTYTGIHLGNFKRHMKTHTGERPFKCNECPYACVLLCELKRHMRIHTGERPFKCKECSYTGIQMGNFKRHMKRHTGERPFKCNECSYAGVILGELKKHMRIHTGERPFKCKECSYASTHSGSIKKHMRTHTGERPFKCKECSYTCADSSNLKIHMVTHTGERPFKCKECVYTSAHLHSLKQHMRTHTGERPFKCKECSYTSAYLSLLKLHMRKHTLERPKS